MDRSSRARAIRDARQESVLARLIKEGLESETQMYSDLPVERWFRSLQSTSNRILRGRMPAQISGPPSGYAFSECVRVLYTIRMVLPAHPGYQVLTADPLVRTEVDTVAEKLFERLKILKREILGNAPIRDANHTLEDDEAWNELMRDLNLDDEAETVAEEDIHTSPEGINLDDLSLESASVYPALASTASQNVPGTIPDEPPSPRYYWIDLYSIEDTAHRRGYIPEEPPVPLSHWIDLRPIEDYKSAVPEVAPEPTSTFLDLLPLEDSSIPEVSPSPVDLTLKLHEAHD